MSRLKRLSKEFTSKLAEFTGGTLSSDEFDKIVSLFELEIRSHYFTSSSESNLLRIIENQFDRKFFLKECIRYPHHVEILISISSNSNYLTDVLVRNPEYFFIIINPDKLNKSLSEIDYQQLVLNSVEPFHSFESRVNALRNLKRREILRIGVRDIYLKTDLKIITLELSLLAKSISKVLLELCYNEVLKKHKIKGSRNKYCLISLGKLGGSELNYSSDIDLMVFTDKNSLLSNRIYYNQLITETIQLFIEQSSSVTSKGFLYRVDFRLRPDGRNAPLCGSLTQYLQYYELRGEDWERQMLIKSGFIGGSLDLFNRFQSYLERFVYPTSFNSSPLTQIRKLKRNMEKNSASEDNIKIASGGIRDIEFSVQALQLLNGGKNKSVRTGNTINALSKLNSAGLINKEETHILKSAYVFYRKTEHYLQLMNDRQTHTIPDSGELTEKMCFHLGYKSTYDLLKTLNDYRNKVSTIYNSITGEEEPSKSTYFTDIDFFDKKRSNQNLEFLQYGKGVLGSKKFDKTTTLNFENIQNDIAEYLSESISPDLVLENLTRVMKSAAFPKIWYKEFIDKNFLKILLKLCEYSQLTINLFAEDKYLRDLFISRKCFEKVDSKTIIELNTKEVVFILSVQFTAGLLCSEELSNLLSHYITKKTELISTSFASDKKWRTEFLLIGAGSLGAGEITLKSDIDLIFVVGSANNYTALQNDFQKLLSEIKTALSPFEVDCRLRPEGMSSYLVWDYNSYKEYIQNRARIWELQAYLKFSFICGKIEMFQNMKEVYIKRIEKIESAELRSELTEMRNKMLSSNLSTGSINLKKSAGTIIDLEFILSYFLLSDHLLARECIGIGSLRSADFLGQAKGILINFDQVKKNFIKLKNIIQAIHILFDTRTPRIPADNIKVQLLSGFLGYDNSSDFNNNLVEIINSNIKFYKNTFNVK